VVDRRLPALVRRAGNGGGLLADEPLEHYLVGRFGVPDGIVEELAQRAAVAAERVPVHELLEIHHHFRGVRIAFVDALAQHARDDLLERSFDHRIERAHQRRILVLDVVHHLGVAAAVERPPPREQLVRHHAEREYVAAHADHFAARLLGRHVRRRSHHLAVVCHQRELVDRFGETEVGDLDSALAREDDVGGLDVAMDEVFGVRGFETVADVEHDRERDVDGKTRLRANELLDGEPVVVLHHDVVRALRLPVVDDVDDVVVLDAGGRFGFLLEARDETRIGRQVREQHLDGDRLLDRLLASLVDDRHPPDGDLLERVVTAYAKYCLHVRNGIRSAPEMHGSYHRAGALPGAPATREAIDLTGYENGS
jgi:hypothetical protein